MLIDVHPRLKRPLSPRFLPAASDLQPKKPTAVRRTSSVTDEDRENAIKVRKNAFKNNGGMFFYETAFDCLVMAPFKGIDLADIARSSSAVSGSPPSDYSIAFVSHSAQ